MQNATIKTKVQTITPEIAQMYLNRNNHNRAFNTATVEDYAEQLRKGLWKLNGEAIILDNHGNLVDGQHRLKACILANKSIESIVIEGVDGDSFATIDTGRARSAGDIFSIEGITQANRKASIITSFFNLRRNESTFNKNKALRQLKASKREVLDFYCANKTLVEDVTDFAGRSYDHIRMFSVSQMGAYVLFLTHDKHHPMEKVVEFFNQLNGASKNSCSATALLKDALLRHFTKQRVLTPALRHVYIVKAWNAYVTDRELKVLNYNREREGDIVMV